MLPALVQKFVRIFEWWIFLRYFRTVPLSKILVVLWSFNLVVFEIKVSILWTERYFSLGGVFCPPIPYSTAARRQTEYSYH